MRIDIDLPEEMINRLIDLVAPDAKDQPMETKISRLRFYWMRKLASLVEVKRDEI